MKYLKLFKKESDYQSFTENDDFVTPNVSFAKEENKVFYNPKMAEYVTFTIRQEKYEDFGMVGIPETTVTAAKGTTIDEFAKDYEYSLNTACLIVDINGKSYSATEYEDEYGIYVLNHVIQNGDSFYFFAC